MTAPPRCLKYGTLPKRGIQRACKKSIVIDLVRGRAGGGRPHRSDSEPALEDGFIDRAVAGQLLKKFNY
jgi:hypothetical protein